MKCLYPTAEKFSSGYLDVSDGHRIYYEQSGNSQGIPVLFVHGGPGAGLSDNYRNFFDPQDYHIIGFDQRGCGRSTPFCSLDNNNTQALLEDITALRVKLGIDKWVLFGGSWGSTLSLLSAIDAPDTVLGMILRGTFLSRRVELEWFLGATSGPAMMFPEAYAQFVEGISGPHNAENISQHYYQWLQADDDITRFNASKRWYQWEERLSRLVLPSGVSEYLHHSALSQMTSLALMECHYVLHQCFIDDDSILGKIASLSHIPATLIHGRYDMICPVDTAYCLHHAWPSSQLQIIPDAGHSMAEPAIAQALCRATKALASFLRD